MSSFPSSASPVASRPAFSPRGLATGIGSLPHRDPAEAVAAVLERLPAFPFWPQLPRRSPLEGMTLQYLEGFPGLRERPEGKDPVVDTGPEGMGEVEAFYGRVLSGDPEAFALSPERAPGFYALEESLVQSRPSGLRFVKGHVTGPVTLATSLRDAGGRDVLHDDTFREVVAVHLARKALWQARRLARLGVPVVIFLDEPVMEVFGSAYSTLSREAVGALWSPALEALAGEGVLTGIHCCGNTDWPVLFDSGAAIVNFDAYHFLEKMLLYPEPLSRFLEAGGVLAWGAVPTAEKARQLAAPALARRLDEGIARMAAAGVDEGLLRRQCLLTPSCGMGSLDPDLAEHILDLLGAVSAGF
ncbi:MAG: hypothetical protein AB1578_22275, partial [Thermodesulfobacteriota bacterium]